MGKRKTGKRVIIAVAIIMAFLLLLLSSLLIADAVCDKFSRIIPNYEKIDLSPLIAKEEWTDEDYETIYRQTGLTRLGADSVQRSELEQFQEALFFAGEVRHVAASPITPHDYLVDPETEKDVKAPIVPLEDGDVLLTSTCHTFGWRNGHAALVTNGSQHAILESITLGMDSCISNRGDEWFRESANFLVLRLKDVSKEERAEIASRAVQELVGVPYSLFVGFFSPKDQCKNGREPNKTHCSHLVWQAFKNAGYDIDSNGGPLCQGRDIARSPLFEVVQVYGFDLDKLW